MPTKPNTKKVRCEVCHLVEVPEDDRYDNFEDADRFGLHLCDDCYIDAENDRLAREPN